MNCSRKLLSPLLLGAAALGVSICGQANAAYINGSFSANFDNGFGTYTPVASLQNATTLNILGPADLINSSGDLSFAKHDNVDIASLPTQPATATLTSYADNVPDFLGIVEEDSDRFVFNLSSISVEDPGVLVIYGYGTLVDTTGALQPTPAEFTASGFHDDGDGSFDGGSMTFATVAPVPEPATAGMLAVAGLVALKRRRRTAR